MSEAAIPISTRWSVDRLIVATALLAITVLSWAYLVWDARRMALGIAHCCVPLGAPWGAGDLLMLFVMWSVMMVAMMVPSAAPMVIVFAGLQRQRRQNDRPYVPTGLFLLGYLLIWTGFSLLATLAQWGLHSAALLSPGMVSTSPIFGGAVLVATGIFQFTPAKRACLGHCRSPMDVLLTQWRDGRRGAIVMGLHHGVFCTGCCWLLMLLLFVVGVMNLLWVAALTVLVLAEKILAGGQMLARVAGVGMIAWGGWMLVRAIG